VGLRGLLAPAGALGAVVLAWGAVAALRPQDAGPTACPWRALTGLDCPFCGSTRAASALARGDLVAALDHNALFVLAIVPLAALAWAAWARSAWRRQPPPSPGNRVWAGLLGLVLVWWAVRLVVPWLGSPAS
jgi:hypothetical protein